MHELDYEQASKIVAAALDRSTQLRCPVSVAVVDVSGELTAFARLPLAPVLTVTVARAKAYTSRALGMSTEQAGGLTGPGQPLYMLETIGGGSSTTIGGGIPLVIDGLVVGGIGVSGGLVAQDIDIASYGAAAFDAGRN